MKQKLLPLLVATGLTMLAGCGGGGGSSDGGGSGGSVSGLDMPSTLSVVTAKEGSSGASVMGLKAGYRAALMALNDPDTDYTKDPTRTFVWDRSIESLSTVNMILCVMEQTRASDMVNKGAYIALVNNDKCETGKNQSSSGESGQSSSGQSKEFQKWTINSTRTDNSSPMIVKIWIPKENSGGSAPQNTGGGNPMDEQQILVETVVTEAVSDSNPFGSFTLNFKGVVDGALVGAPAGTEAEMMKGALFTVSNGAGKPEFKFIEIAGDAMGGNTAVGFEHVSSSHVLLDDANGNTGQAMTHTSESFSYDDDMNPDTPDAVQSFSDTFAVAFDATHFKRYYDSDDNTKDETVCTSRTQFNSNVWRYNLYHAADGTFNGNTVTAGQRVELNSGFPFTYDGKFGHVGYWGVWYEGGDLADGTTIQKVDFSTGTSTDYQVHVAPGRLIHRMASQEMLSQYQNDYEFSFWGAHPTLLDGTSNPLYGQWHVKVNSSNNFEVVDSFTWGESGPVSSVTIDHDNNTGTAEVSVVAEFAPSEGEYLWLWSDALGGNITYVHKDDINGDTVVDAADAALREVTLYSQEYVLPGDAAFGTGTSFTVYCYDRCAKGGLTQIAVDAMTSQDELFHPPLNVNWMTNPPTMVDPPYAYTVEKSGGKVIVKDHNGDVVSADGLDLSALGYDWGLNTAEMVISQSGINVPWDVFQAADSYRWETGSNQWNKQITVVKVSDGSYASFDKPLEFNYTHSTANDANGDATFDGKKFRLQYGGPGELWGFPWSEDDSGRWHAAFTLADGAEMGDGTNSFVVKGMEKEQTMLDVDVAMCSSLSVDNLSSTLPLPTSSDIGTVSFTLADKPTVTDAPAVIEGELQ